MKNNNNYLKILVVLIIGLLSLFSAFTNRQCFTANSNSEINTENYPEQNKIKEQDGEEDEAEAGPEVERKYFEQMHYPYGEILDQKTLNRTWADIKKVKQEQELFAPSAPWILSGPYGSLIPSTNTRFTGRVLDINIRDTANIKIGAATGGLWQAGSPNPVALTEQITSQAASTFDVQPGNSSVIILGTGEPFMRAGTGLYRTSDGGATWSSISMNDTIPGEFYKIRYSSPNVVHAASIRGYYRSDDNGLNWNKYMRGDISDIAINPVNTNILYCARRQDNGADTGGVYKSTDGGSTWNRMTQGIPVNDVGRTSVSICANNPAFVYVLMSKKNGDMQGIYRTAGGDFWTNCSPPEDIFGGLGWYTAPIGVCPTSPGTVLAGGIWLWKTTNLGLNWTQIDNNYDINVHSDQHSIAWSSDGNSVWIGNDGGVTFSNDQGYNFNTLNNRWPITQYYNIDVCLSNPDVIIGGSQDNGITGTTDGGATWKYYISWGGDGSGAAINPFNAAEMYMTIGVYGGNWAFQRHRSTNYGQNWTGIDNGIAVSNQWFTKIKTDNVNPVTVYTSSADFLYYSTNKGDNWVKRNNTSFPAWISNFSVRKYTDTSIVYVVTDSRSAGERIFLQDGPGNFSEKSADITDGLTINAVTMHPNNNNIAFAVVKGMFQGQKVYKTTNRGTNWVNISSNLPNVSMTDLIINPDDNNTLYLGSEMGCYKTTDGGVSWFRWNNGLPEAVIVNQLKSYVTSEGFFILAGTYGRGIWSRKEDAPVGISQTSEGLPVKFKLNQNYPNPFNPGSKIKFQIAKLGNAKLIVYDVLGREVSKLVDAQLKPGTYEVNFNGSSLSSGIYFYKLEADGFMDVKKMILIK